MFYMNFIEIFKQMHEEIQFFKKTLKMKTMKNITRIHLTSKLIDYPSSA